MVTEYGSLAEQVANLDPESDEFSVVAEVVAAQTEGLRNQTGRAPYRVFLASLQMQGVYPCIEAILRGPGGELLLKTREANENVTVAEQDSWGGRLHIPGTTFYPLRSPEANLRGLISKEIVNNPDTEPGKTEVDRLVREIVMLGFGIYPEPERRTSALTYFVGMSVPDLSLLQPGYQAVTAETLDRVIEQHRPTVSRILSGEEQLFFDTRSL